MRNIIMKNVNRNLINITRACFYICSIFFKILDTAQDLKIYYKQASNNTSIFRNRCWKVFPVFVGFNKRSGEMYVPFPKSINILAVWHLKLAFMFIASSRVNKWAIHAQIIIRWSNAILTYVCSKMANKIYSTKLWGFCIKYKQ